MKSTYATGYHTPPKSRSAANSFLNDTVVGSCVWDLFEGKIPIRRAWITMGYFIVLVISVVVVGYDHITGKLYANIDKMNGIEDMPFFEEMEYASLDR